MVRNWFDLLFQEIIRCAFYLFPRTENRIHLYTSDAIGCGLFLKPPHAQGDAEYVVIVIAHNGSLL